MANVSLASITVPSGKKMSTCFPKYTWHTSSVFPSLTNEKKKFNRLQYYLKFVIIYCFIFNWLPSRCSKADFSSFIPPSSEPWYTPHRRWNLIYTPFSVICLMCTWRFRGFFVEHLNDNTKREIKNYELRHTGNEQKGYFCSSRMFRSRSRYCQFWNWLNST